MDWLEIPDLEVVEGVSCLEQRFASHVGEAEGGFLPGRWNIPVEELKERYIATCGRVEVLLVGGRLRKTCWTSNAGGWGSDAFGYINECGMLRWTWIAFDRI